MWCIRVIICKCFLSYNCLKPGEIKEILRKRIAEKKKEVNPRLYNKSGRRGSTELETLQSFLADITDEEARHEMIKNSKN